MAAGIQPPAGGARVVRDATGMKARSLYRGANLRYGLHAEKLFGISGLIERQRNVELQSRGPFRHA